MIPSSVEGMQSRINFRVLLPAPSIADSSLEAFPCSYIKNMVIPCHPNYPHDAESLASKVTGQTPCKQIAFCIPLPSIPDILIAGANLAKPHFKKKIEALSSEKH